MNAQIHYLGIPCVLYHPTLSFDHCIIKEHFYDNEVCMDHRKRIIEMDLKGWSKKV